MHAEDCSLENSLLARLHIALGGDSISKTVEWWNDSIVNLILLLDYRSCNLRSFCIARPVEPHSILLAKKLLIPLNNIIVEICPETNHA